MAALGPLLLLAAGAAMLRWTWGAWPDPLVDFGRELYVPWRLSEGDRLYTDVAWFNGPLSQQYHALLFRVLGPGLSVLVWSNALVLAGTVAMLYALVVRLADRLTATAAGLVFLLVFGFGQYVGIGNYNWITPYSHELTHGVALALAAVVGLDRWRRKGSLASGGLGGLALGLCFLTKPETFLAGAAGAAALLASAAGPRASGGSRVGPAYRADARAWGVLAGFAGLPVLLSVALIGARGTLGAWPSALAGDVAALPFYRALAGLDAPGRRLLELLAWTGAWGLLVAAVVAVAWRARGTRGALVPLATAATLLSVFVAGGDLVPWDGALRPLPLFAAAVGAALVGAMRRGPRELGLGLGDRAPAALALTALALALLAKVVLHVRVGHYGFALAVPGCMVLVTALVGWLPAWLDRRGARGDAARAGALALLAVFAVAHLSTTAGWLAAKTQSVGAGRDAFRADVRGAFVQAAVADVMASGAGSLAVLPEGVGINYLSRTPNPTPYVTFMPPEELLFGDGAWAEAFRASPPQVIVIVPKDTSEYGRGAFGEGYGRALAAWIAAEYVQTRVIRVEGVGFEVRILERRTTG